MDVFPTLVVCVFFIVVGALVAIYARKIVNWLYEKTMSFWTKKIDSKRKDYTDQKYQEVWYWKAWWAWGIWTYRIVGVLIVVFFTVVLVMLLTQ
jgi:hypothetical protein